VSLLIARALDARLLFFDIITIDALQNDLLLLSRVQISNSFLRAGARDPLLFATDVRVVCLAGALKVILKMAPNGNKSIRQ
jgi:hypothetical protein